jgi:hypothetical protein
MPPPVSYVRRALAAVAVLATLAGCGSSSHRTTSRAVGSPPRGATVTVSLGAAGVEVPAGFFGLSFEYPELPEFEAQPVVFDRVLRLLHGNSPGRLILRVGGDSADHTYWTPHARSLPPDSLALTPGWFRATSDLVRRLGLQLILDLNLAHGSPPDVAAEARSALALLPPASIVGFEVGNEPDRYGPTYSIPRYLASLGPFADAIRQSAPNVPVLGPAITSTASNFNWLVAVMAQDPRQVDVLTGHFYPLSACAAPASGLYPSVDRLLSDNATVGLARSVAPAVKLAHRAGVRFRLDELNSVTCGGLAGTSDAFATALWAPDALFSLLQTGLDGLNLHIRSDKINAPFALTQSGLAPRPLLYGLILFTRAVDNGGSTVQMQLGGEHVPGLSAWAIRGPGGRLRVLLINRGDHAVSASLQLAAQGALAVERLLGSGPNGTEGTTLAGQTLGPQGTWIGRKVVESIPRAAGGYRVTVPAFSAALVRAELATARP